MRNFLAGVIAPIFGLNHPDSVNHLVRRVDRALARSSELREDIGMTQRTSNNEDTARPDDLRPGDLDSKSR